MSFLRLWLLFTGAVVAGGLTWSFAPILIPVFLITGLLTLVVAGVIAGARRIEARHRPDRGSQGSGPDMQPRQ